MAATSVFLVTPVAATSHEVAATSITKCVAPVSRKGLHKTVHSKLHQLYVMDYIKLRTLKHHVCAWCTESIREPNKLRTFVCRRISSSRFLRELDSNPSFHCWMYLVMGIKLKVPEKNQGVHACVMCWCLTQG